MEKVTTIPDLAKALGDVHQSTVYRWVEWGLEELKTEEGWDVEEVRVWAREMKKARRKVLRPAFDVSDDLDEDSEQDWSKTFRKARAIGEILKTKRLQAQLVERKEIEDGWALRVAELTTALDSLAAQLAPKLSPLTRESEIQGVLREAFHQLRDHFARD